MNIGVVRYICGWVLLITGAFMLLPALCAWCYGETAGVAFLYVIGGCVLVGVPMILKKPKNQTFYTADGFISVALSWIVMSLVGALPFVICGGIPSYVDAVFETVSGFTTTGASILPAVEDLPKCMLFWRSETHWLGGMGVLVFLLCLLPLTGGSRMNLMKAESPGPSVSRLVPKVSSTAKYLYGIYVVLTMIQILLLVITRMNLFDAITLSFGTAGTGGFAVRNDGFASYTMLQQAIITVFMILFGINFNMYFLLIMRKFRGAQHMEEVWVYLGVIVVSIGAITWNTCDMEMYNGSVGQATHHAAFTVGSIITTTGFSTVDFDLWPALSKTILCLLMFCGACAGSTGGGIKVSRLLLWLKTLKNQMLQAIHPQAVCRVKMDGKVVEEETIRGVNTYMVAYAFIFVVSLLMVSLDNHDMTTNFTAVSATMNNIGPGLGLVGPTQNFGFFSVASKLVLSVDMLLGRLEIFPLLLLFSRKTWKKF